MYKRVPIHDVAADWERFRGEWENYEIATDLDGTSGKKRSAVFLACIGSAAQSIFRSFKFDSADDRNNVSKIIEAFERYCIGETNVTYERYRFNRREQQPGESIEDFVADLRKMANTCQFEALEDSLIRDRIIVGIRDEPTRRRLLQQKKLTLSEAIDACKASEATSRRLRVMGGAAEIDALHHSTSAASSSPSSHRRRSASKSRRDLSCSRTDASTATDSMAARKTTVRPMDRTAVNAEKQTILQRYVNRNSLMYATLKLKNY
jgi:hypothetical protein